MQGHTYCPWSWRWRKFRILVVIDEFSPECLALYVARTIKAADVIDVLSDLMLERGVPEFIRSDNGPEFASCKPNTAGGQATIDFAMKYS